MSSEKWFNSSLTHKTTLSAPTAIKHNSCGKLALTIIDIKKYYTNKSLKNGLVILEFQ